MDPELPRKNLRLGLLLFALVLILFAGSIVVAEIYNASDGLNAFITVCEPASDGIRARGQGPLRHGRPADDVRLGDLPRPRSGAHRHGGHAARGGGLRHRSARRTCTSSPTGSRPRTSTAATSSTRSTRTASRAARAAAPRPRSPRASATRRSEPTRAARSASRPRAAGSSASSPRTAWCRWTGSFRSRRPSTTRGRWRGDVAECAAMMSALDPPLPVDTGRPRRPPRGASPGSTRPIPPSAARVEEAAALFGRGRGEFPFPSCRRSTRCSCARSPTSTATSSPSTPTSTAQRPQEGRALPRDHRRGVRGGPRGARAVPDEARRGARRLRPPRRAHDRDRGALRSLAERELRPSVLRFTEPFNVLGWPALALPCGAAENGLPASVSLVAPAGEDALVLGVGLALEAELERC